MQTCVVTAKRCWWVLGWGVLCEQQRRIALLLETPYGLTRITHSLTILSSIVASFLVWLVHSLSPTTMPLYHLPAITHPLRLFATPHSSHYLPTLCHTMFGPLSLHFCRVSVSVCIHSLLPCRGLIPEAGDH